MKRPVVTDLEPSTMAPGLHELWLHLVDDERTAEFDGLLHGRSRVPRGSSRRRAREVLFWQTKSAVQPLGAEDEWPKLLAMPEAVRKWADRGASHSALRPGAVDTSLQGPEAKRGYRGLMSKI